MSTIVAIATAPGNAGIGIVRISGKDSFSIIQKIFCPVKPKTIKGYTIQYGTIMNEEKEVIDEVLVSFFVAPKSYTGENVCEINSHGNSLVLKRIIELCLKNGAVLAEPGEFTKRAFLNGRIDLLQAEAVIDIIESKSELERKAAVRNLEGFLSKDIHQIKGDILEILTQIEVSIDYPEYDIEENSYIDRIERMQKIENALASLEESFDKGKILKDGVEVAIVGRPNAGKSSLLNKILKEERAIVTDIEGTTRDTIEEFINIQGIPFKVIDTAGIRKASNAIEKIGIDKSKKVMQEADLILAIFDASKELKGEDFEILEEIKNKKAIILLNKKDIKESQLKKEEMQKYHFNILETSTKTGEGIDKLYQKMAEMFYAAELSSDQSSIITNIRHKEAIHHAKENIKIAKDLTKKNETIDIIAIYLKQAMEEMNKITGENVTEDLINDIFSKFCLGK